MANYMIARFDEIEAVKCPCGFAKRAFALPDNSTATMHIVDIPISRLTRGCITIKN